MFSDRLQAYCVARKVFHNNQCGFQPNRRTTDVVSLLLNDARTCLDQNKPCVVTAVDFSKAYDTVWHAGLLHKLAVLYGVSGNFLRWVKSFLEGREVRVTGLGQHTTWRKTRCGVPQGSSVSPVLFVLYTNDFRVRNPKVVNLGVFADDTAFWTKPQYEFRSSKVFQEELDHLEQWCRRWKLVLNPTKTEQLKFVGRKQKSLSSVGDWSLTVGGQPVRRVKVMKYLGVVLDEKLQFEEHARKVENALKAQLCALYKLTTNFGSVNPVTLVQLYKLQSRPVWEYGAEFYLNTKSKVERLQRLQNKFIRLATRVSLSSGGT